MKLLFRQRVFSWFDKYDIYDEKGDAVYTVKGQLSWGHCLKIFDTRGEELGTVKEKIVTLLPKFEIYERNRRIGRISRELTIIKPKYEIDFNGWHADGSWTGWNYTITDRSGETVAVVAKKLLHMSDTYVIDIVNEKDALHVLMFVLAVDAEKCTRDEE